jgi:plasmid maintenance system antidote protein VapI
MGGSERGKKNELIEQNDDTEHSGVRHMTTELLEGLFFSMDPRYWLNLQAEYDMRTVANRLP